MLAPTSARATWVSVLASSTNREPGLSAPGFTTTLSSTPGGGGGVKVGVSYVSRGCRCWSEDGSLVSLVL